MIDFRPALSASTFALALGVMALPAAAAVDGQTVFERLAAQLALQGIEISAEEVRTDGDDVAISGLRATFEPGGDPVELGNQVLENVSEADGGSYRVERIAVAPLSRTEDGMTVEFEGAAINDYLIAGPEVTDPVLRSGLFRSFEAGALTVSGDQGTVFSMQGASAETDGYSPGGTMNFSLNVDGLVADMTQLPEAEARETMASLGYEELRGDITGSGSWDAETGRLQLDELRYRVEDAATLSISFDIEGYTPQLIGAMQQMQAQMVEQGNAEAMNMAMMGLMQQLEINSVTIELDDASLTDRIVDFVAEQQGMNRESVIAMAKGVLPVGLAQLQNPAFAAEVTAAVGAFLDDPQSLRIAVQPSGAVPVAQIMAAAMSSPQALIETLGVSVTANE